MSAVESTLERLGVWRDASERAALLSRLGINRDTAWFARRKNLAHSPIVPSDGMSLSMSEQFYVVHAPVRAVFDEYVAAPPFEVWPKERIEFRFAYAPGGDVRLEPTQPWPGLQEGMRLFADLKVWPLQAMQLMVGVEITRVQADREIRYDYLDGSVTLGFNRMRFEADADDPRATHVHHYSEYRGTSLRDRLLMPLLQPVLHVGFVNAMHYGMRARIEAKCASAGR